jgi:phosphoribosyl-ATP pyrophosphohydrolase
VTPAPQPLDKLERTIADRAANPNEKSYTSQLLAGGVEKMRESRGSGVVAATGKRGRRPRHFIREVGDFIIT